MITTKLPSVLTSCRTRCTLKTRSSSSTCGTLQAKNASSHSSLLISRIQLSLLLCLTSHLDSLSSQWTNGLKMLRIYAMTMSYSSWQAIKLIWQLNVRFQLKKLKTMQINVISCTLRSVLEQEPTSLYVSTSSPKSWQALRQTQSSRVNLKTMASSWASNQRQQKVEQRQKEGRKGRKRASAADIQWI